MKSSQSESNFRFYSNKPVTMGAWPILYTERRAESKKMEKELSEMNKYYS